MLLSASERGGSYRVRAEKRQSEYRSRTLCVSAGEYDHHLSKEAANEGRNFVIKEAHRAAIKRHKMGKGVAHRTFNNMLSSQAMCFNLFAPLAADTDLAARILSKLLPISGISDIIIEHTPSNELFKDQSTLGGVDCDVLIIGSNLQGHAIAITLETKFVEREFSHCGFISARNSTRICPADIDIIRDPTQCLYEKRKGYRYWKRSQEYSVLRDGAFPAKGCPFVGPMWQLWVNRTLAAAESAQRHLEASGFAILAPMGNKRLFAHDVLNRFRDLLTEPSSFWFIELEDMIGAIQAESPECSEWAHGLRARYAGI